MKRYFVFQVLGLIAYLVFATTGFSAPLTSQDVNKAASESSRIQRNELIRLKQDLKQIQKRRGKENKVIIQAPKAVVSKGPARCWVIQHIILEGVTLLSKSEQGKILKNFTGKCLKLSDINALLTAITKAYFRKGYITSRAYISPGQNLAKGQLKLFIVEGKLEGIRLKDNRGNKSIALNFVFPGMKGKALNLRDIEQGLEQISRLPSNSVTMNIEPGTKPGSSILLIKNKAREPFTYSTSANNLGSQSTGRNQASLSVFVDNPMDMVDSFGLTFRRSFPVNTTKFSNSLTANYSIPYGYSTFSLTESFSNYAISIPLSKGSTAEMSGNTLNLSATADRMVYRSQAGKLHISMTLRINQNKNFLQGSLIAVSSYNLTALDFSMGYSTSFLDGLVSATVGYSKGLRWLDANVDPANQPAGGLKAQFNKYLYSLNYMLPFRVRSLSFTFVSRLSGQQSNDALYGNEQFSIGGFYSVRGFQGMSIAGNTGSYLRNSLSFNWQRGKLSAAPFFAFDIGKVNSSFGNNGGILGGMAYGIKLNYSRLSLSLTDTKSLRSPGFINQTSNYLYLQLSTSF